MYSFFNKIIILIPHPKLPGGVSNYYKVARKHFSSNVRYVNFNSRYNKGFLKSICNILAILKVFFIIIVCFPKRVVVNPSLGKTAIFRDGLFLLWSHFLFKKTVVFWRGWNTDNEYIFIQKVFKFLFKYSYLTAHKHFVLNQYIRKNLMELGVCSENISFTNTIVDDSLINHLIDKEKKDSFVVLFLTRVEKYKGVYEVLEIIETLSSKELNIEFHIAGDGKELDAIKQIVLDRKYSNVKFLGYVDGEEKIKAFKNSDIYLFPSYSEGMPNSVIEAMGCGLPVVCTKVGALGDFFKNGIMGYIFPLPINVKYFAESIDNIYSNKSLQNEMSNYNIEYAKEHFLASKSIEKLELLINE